MEVTHTQDADELVTVSEAARIAFLSSDTIRRYADKGVLAVVRTPSNHRRFRRADVEALMTTGVVKPLTGPVGGAVGTAAADTTSAGAA
jgi:excisionase family DNA binding protein